MKPRIVAIGGVRGIRWHGPSSSGASDPPWQGVGGMMRLDRAGARWAMKMVSQVGIYDCVNARDPAHEPILRKLLTPGTRITALDPTPHEPGPACLAHIDGSCVQ